MTRPWLFRPIEIGSLTLPNRIVIAPMCQYSAVDGEMTDWHQIHLGHLALSGAGLLTIEATAVLPEGRISWADVGLWSDACESAIDRTLESVRRWSDIPIAIQLAHAGRKASHDVPWQGGRQIPPGDTNGWQTVAPSALPWDSGERAPEALDAKGIRRVVDAFGEAATRSKRLGIDAIEIHAAHGYLLHEFLSPLSNQRSDDYGGSFEGRTRLLLEVYDAIRDACGGDYPVIVRVSGTDWVEGGWDVEQTARLATVLETRGCDAIHISSGGLDPRQSIEPGPGYQVPLAHRVRQDTRMPVIAVGEITGFDQAEGILRSGAADLVALARGILYNPRWPWHAAAHLGAQVDAPRQYLRAAPTGASDVFRRR
jgi:2,4-dienoyl-CoA reductase-like NADH-dependent reductase (Old Yellow Enzyme family)